MVPLNRLLGKYFLRHRAHALQGAYHPRDTRRLPFIIITSKQYLTASSLRSQYRLQQTYPGPQSTIFVAPKNIEKSVVGGGCLLTLELSGLLKRGQSRVGVSIAWTKERRSREARQRWPGAYRQWRASVSREHRISRYSTPKRSVLFRFYKLGHDSGQPSASVGADYICASL